MALVAKSGSETLQVGPLEIVPDEQLAECAAQTLWPDFKATKETR